MDAITTNFHSFSQHEIDIRMRVLFTQLRMCIIVAGMKCKLTFTGNMTRALSFVSTSLPSYPRI